MNFKLNNWDIPTNLNCKDFQWVDKTGKAVGEYILGRGSYAEVRLCRNKYNRLFACKIIPKKKVIKLKMEAYIKQEINLHLGMDHPHILKLFGCAQDRKNVYLYLDFCRNNCLYHHLRRKGKLSENSSFTFFFQTALGN